MRRIIIIGSAWLVLTGAGNVQGGGSGLNTIVVVNQNSSNSCEVANYYCERRQVPPENVLRINWAGNNISWTSDEYQTNLLNPLLTSLVARRLTNQIDYVVLSMDIPYQTWFGSAANGTTSVLFYGLKNDSGPDWLSTTNSYAASEQIFGNAKPESAQGYSFLATMITAPSVSQAKRIIDQGVASDGTFPTQPVLLAKSSDYSRNIRFHAFDNAQFNARFCRNYSVQRTNCDAFWGQTNLLGIQTGLYQFSASANTFIPGAMADSLTSYGGVIFGYNDQTSLMALINAGASGSYGTVTEPSPIPDKFPDPQNYFYQARGFTLGECYYQSLVEPYEGLIVGEPLAAPCRKLAKGQWIGIASNAVLSGTAPLSVQFTAPDTQRPVQQIDLFVDGKYYSTLTNARPATGNILNVALKGFPLSYSIPENANLTTIASGLADLINLPANSNITKIVACAHGDRVELRSTFTNRSADWFYYADTGGSNSAFRYYRTAYLPPPSAPALTPIDQNLSGLFRLHVETPFMGSAVVQASTNLSNWTPIFTNLANGPFDFVDSESALYPKRFYRILASVPDNRPKLSPTGNGSTGAFKLHAESATPAAYTIDASVDLRNWTPLLTNSMGGASDFEDLASPNYSRRFYRVSLITPPATNPAMVLLGQAPNGGSLLRVDSGPQPYVILGSSDLSHWIPLFTNLTVGQTAILASSDKGSGLALSSFLSAGRDTFLNSTAYGIQACTINGVLSMGTWLQAIITKTNGVQVRVGVTNQLFSGSIMDLTQLLVGAINSNPDLQGSDGLVAEDLTTGWFGSGYFNLRARSPGIEAASIRVLFDSASGLVRNPRPEFSLFQNLSDLQPRNHLYVAAGAAQLAAASPLDTKGLADGYHELTAVAYEGTHVRTQSRITVPVVVTNSPLKANLNLLDLAATNSVIGTYHLQVTANTNDVKIITLFTTGGVVNVVSNQSTANFTISGNYLGAGLHPIYAIVETSSGTQYRTARQWVRFVNP